MAIGADLIAEMQIVHSLQALFRKNAIICHDKYKAG